MITNRSLNIYGSVQLEKAYCTKCNTTAFILDGKLQCCNAPVEASNKDLPVKYIVEARNKRNLYQNLLKEQY